MMRFFGGIQNGILESKDQTVFRIFGKKKKQTDLDLIKNLHAEWIQQIKCNGFMILGFLWTRSEKVNSRARMKCWILKRKRTLILRPVSNIKLHMSRPMQMREQQIFFITIKFGTCKGRRLKRAFKHVSLVPHVHIYIFFVFFENVIENKCVAINSQLHKEFTR